MLYQKIFSFSSYFHFLKLLTFLSPAARVMPTLPKQERPAREGARVASVETGLAAAAAKLAQQVSLGTAATFCLPREIAFRVFCIYATFLALCYLSAKEQQKPAKRKYTKKQRPPPPVVTSPPIPPEPTPPSPPPAAESTGDLSPDRRMDYFSASLLDHEYTAGPGPFGPGGPRGTGAMAPGVFLTSRRPSLSPQNSSSQSGGSVAGSASQSAAGVGQGEYSQPFLAALWSVLGEFFSNLFSSFHFYSGRRPKKGLATAKQRLGKILKIHRNGKLLL